MSGGVNPNPRLDMQAARKAQSLPMRRFFPPWTVETIAGGFKVIDANGQSLAYVYGHADPRYAGIANVLNSR